MSQCRIEIVVHKHVIVYIYTQCQPIDRFRLMYTRWFVIVKKTQAHTGVVAHVCVSINTIRYANCNTIWVVLPKSLLPSIYY